jgi:prepilin-type N-terminal cleavage/methylation domain-containing protein
MRQRRGVARGFTLVELIAVLVIGSVIFVAVGINVKSSTFTVQASRADVLRALFYARQLAMSRSSMLRSVQFIATAHSIDIKENGESLVNYPLRFPSGVSITTGIGTLVFDKLGRTNTSIETLITLSGAGASSVVIVDASGYAY